MTYRPQLEEDMHQDEAYETPLTKDQQEVLNRIKRPQLQQDIYESMIFQEEPEEERRV